MPREPGRGRLLAAQARVIAGLVAGADPRVAGPSVRAALREPRVEEASLAGCPSTLARPARGDGPWPAVALFPGVTRLGRFHPALQRVARGLAASGHLTAIVEPAGLAAGVLTPSLVYEARAALLELAGRRDALDRRIGLVGVSAGGTTALLCAAEHELAGRVSAVAVIAPCCDLEQAVRVVTTGFVREGARMRPFESAELFRLVIARSLVACLPDGPGRQALLAHLLSLPEYGPDPLEALRSWPAEELEPAARATHAVLANTDPERFDELYAALGAGQRESLHTLSAAERASHVTAPVEVVIAKEDKYIPRADADAFVSRCPTARVTVLSSLSHAVPAFSVGAAPDLVRLDAALVRFLAAVRAPSYSSR